MKQQFTIKRRGRFTPCSRQLVAAEIRMARRAGAVFYITTINGKRSYRIRENEYVPEEWACLTC